MGVGVGGGLGAAPGCQLGNHWGSRSWPWVLAPFRPGGLWAGERCFSLGASQSPLVGAACSLSHVLVLSLVLRCFLISNKSVNLLWAGTQPALVCLLLGSWHGVFVNSGPVSEASLCLCQLLWGCLIALTAFLMWPDGLSLQAGNRTLGKGTELWRGPTAGQRDRDGDKGERERQEGWERGRYSLWERVWLFNENSRTYKTKTQCSLQSSCSEAALLSQWCRNACVENHFQSQFLLFILLLFLAKCGGEPGWSLTLFTSLFLKRFWVFLRK